MHLGYLFVSYTHCYTVVYFSVFHTYIIEEPNQKEFYLIPYLVIYMNKWLGSYSSWIFKRQIYAVKAYYKKKINVKMSHMTFTLQHYKLNQILQNKILYTNCWWSCVADWLFGLNKMTVNTWLYLHIIC